MKNLTIVRHAKSSWADASLDDHDRPLNRRGERVVPLIGDALATRIDRPSLVLSSTARRARATAEVVAGKLGYPEAEIASDGRIYHAALPELLQVLREVDETHPSAIVFGHVPGVQALTNALCPATQIAHFPTCGASVVELEIDYWGEVDAGVGKLIDFLIPKELFEGA